MPPTTFSPLATPVPRPRDVADRTRVVPWGVCVHTTGGGVPQKAARLGEAPLAVAVETYLLPDNPAAKVFPAFPHYVIDGEGAIAQIADENRRARHVAIADTDRLLYLDGRWRKKVSQVGLDLWDRKWGAIGKRNPVQLYPSRTPNNDYLGIELIPQLQPLADGGKFTPEQYERLGALLEDIEGRYGITLEGPRLVGHEDLSPLTRWTSKGGWDPGALCAQPVFSWARVQRSDGWPFAEE